MNYFYLKIGKANCHARQWLSNDNELGRPGALIFFDNRPEDDYAAGAEGLYAQAHDFYKCGLPENHANTRMIVIFEGRLWILKPAGKVQFLPPKPEETGGETLTRKVMPVDIIAERDLKDVPAVLAGLPADQYLCRGTFRKIGHWGNLKAVDVVLNKFCRIEPDWNAEHWAEKKQGEAQLLECLGSTGLETLVARVFEAAGCFVPARTGGMLRDIDLFAHNDGNAEIVFDVGKLGVLRVLPKSCLSVQVKTWPTGKARFKSAAVDCLIGLQVAGGHAYDARWLLTVVLQYPAVCEWLARSLEWLPAKLRKRFGL